MNSFFRKKQVVISTMVLALGVAVFMNWYFAGNNVQLDASKVLDTAKNLGDAQYVSGTTQSNLENNEEETTLSASIDTTLENEETKDVMKNSTEEDYFTKAKLNRQIARDDAVDVLEELIDDSSVSDTSKIQAVSKIAIIAENVKIENDIENLVMAKGFTNCIAIISDSNVQVVVEGEQLMETQVVQIKEIVLNQGEFSPENVSVIEVK